MGKIAEDSQFYKGKKEILDEFSGSHRTLMTTVASRNFSHPPGYLFESSIMLEETGKNKLSALNYQIVSDAIERELKQTGHNYTQTYKASRIAFEIEKQTLLMALQQEFADLDATQSLSEEELNNFYIELDVRKLILITTKTSIEIEMEELKQSLMATDRLTFDNESSLTDEKVTTATKKLEVLPYLQSIIDAQEKLLDEENTNIRSMNSLINTKESLVDKKGDLIPYYIAKSSALTELSAALISAAAQESIKLGILEDTVGLKTDVIDNRLDAIDADIATENLRNILYEARYSLQNLKASNNLDLMLDAATNVQTITDARATMETNIISYISSMFSGKLSADGLVKDQQLLSDSEVSGIKTQAELSAIRNVARENARARTETATAAAAAEITSKLIHLIGG
jgi:hypothetical protein